MSDRESTPEVQIRYGVSQDKDGFRALVKIQQRGPFTMSGPKDKDAALEIARRMAHDEASKYRGEWTISVEAL